jgi:hypothetical protein
LLPACDRQGSRSCVQFSHGSKCLTGTCLRSKQRCHASTAAKLFARAQDVSYHLALALAPPAGRARARRDARRGAFTATCVSAMIGRRRSWGRGRFARPESQHPSVWVAGARGSQQWRRINKRTSRLPVSSRPKPTAGILPFCYGGASMQ